MTTIKLKVDIVETVWRLIFAEIYTAHIK